MSDARRAAALHAAIVAAERATGAGVRDGVVLADLYRRFHQIEEKRAKEAAPRNERDWPDRNTT